jgi:hypothetical protein
MTETPTRRGRPRGVESHHVMVRMPVDLITQIDAYAASLQEQIAISDVNISRGMAIRELVKRGLQSLSTSQPQPAPSIPPQPAIPLALEPAPAAEVQPSHERKTPSTRRKGGNPGLSPETLQQIADMAAQYDKLSRRELSQLLYDRGIYRARAKDGREVPVNRGTLQKWLDQAEQAGLL